MSTPFLWTHWGHLATKPAQSLALYLPLRWFGVAPWTAVVVALVVPALVSAVRKQVLWPGCFRHLDVWKDEFADTWAAAVGVLPLAITTMPLVYRVVFGFAMLGVLWPGGLHKWALP